MTTIQDDQLIIREQTFDVRVEMNAKGKWHATTQSFPTLVGGGDTRSMAIRNLADGIETILVARENQ